MLNKHLLLWETSQFDIGWCDSNWHNGAGTVGLISLTSWTPLISSSELLLWSISITSHHHHEIDWHGTVSKKSIQFTPVTTTIILKNVGFPFFTKLSLPHSDPCHHHHHPDRPQVVAPRQGRGHPHLQRQELCFQVHRLKLEIWIFTNWTWK